MMSAVSPLGNVILGDVDDAIGFIGSNDGSVHTTVLGYWFPLGGCWIGSHGFRCRDVLFF